VTYAEALAAESKDRIVVWDFPSLLTRFATKRTDDWDIVADKWTIFEGAIPHKDNGSKYDLRTGRITIGTAEFSIPDTNGAVATWMAANDDTLANTNIVRRQGFKGVPEDEWKNSNWILQDYKISDPGGGFVITLENILARMATGLYEGYDGEAYEFDAVIEGVNWGVGATSISLNKSPKGLWPEPGHVIVYDESTKWHELVEYQTIGGTGNKVLTTLTRKKWLVGNPLTNFVVADARVVSVWIKRGSPVNVLLEMLTTTDPPVEILTDGGLEAWDDSITLTNWTKTPKCTTLRKTSSPAPYNGTYFAGINTTVGEPDSFGGVYQDITGLKPDTVYLLELYIHPESATDPVDIALGFENTTREVYFTPTGINAGNQADHNTWTEGFWSNGTVFIDETSPYLDHVGLTRIKWDWSTAQWHYQRFYIRTPATSHVLDTYRLYIGDRYPRRAWYDGFSLLQAKNGDYDLQDSSGLGIDVSAFDVVQLETVRDEFWPEPVFTSDVLTSGNAILLVEKDPIDSVKDLAESILHGFALAITVNDEEQLGAEINFRVPATPLGVNDDWIKHLFKPAKWARNYRKTLNGLVMKSDWQLVDDEYGVERSTTNELSVAAYKASITQDLEARGGRTGLFGFPDYASQSDLAASAARIMLDAGSPGSEFPILLLYKYKDTSLIDTLRLNVPGVLDINKGVIGVVDGLFLVIQRKVDDKLGRLELLVRERILIGRQALVAPDSVSASYDTATDDDKQYNYLTENNEDQFDDDTPAYTVV
jgi:hypothetical protein